MGNRIALSQQQKHETFKTAFDTYKKYLDSENFIGAYVVAFSILEDRITAAYMLLQDHLKKNRPTKLWKLKFSQKINPLHENGFISQTAINNFRMCANNRNLKFHAAMWNLNEFSAEDCQKVIKLAREADKLSRKLKKLTTKNEPKS